MKDLATSNLFFNKLRNILSINLSFLNLIWSFVLIFFIAIYQLKDGVHTLPFAFGSLLIVIGSLMTINLFWHIISLVSNNRPRFRKVAFYLFFVFLWLLASYHFKSKNYLDFAVIADNTGEAFNLSSLLTITDAVGVVFLILLPVLLVFLVFMDKKFSFITRVSHQGRLVPKTILLVIIYGLLVSLPFSTQDNFLIFFKSIFNYYTEDAKYIVQYERGTYPFLHEIKSKPGKHLSDTKPHIFIIMLESLNYSFIETKSQNGKEYMPFFNSLIKRSLFSEIFYGNSNQTCKGQFASFFSLIPSIRGKVFKRYQKITRFNSLPEILRTNGYDTIFFQCYKNLSYDNTEGFLKANGFNAIDTVFNYLQKSDDKSIWGWGVEDSVFIQRFFGYLDNRKNNTVDNKPYFVTLATTVNHRPFDHVPDSMKFIYTNTTSIRQDYANSIHLSDIALEEFFIQLNKRDYLTNSIVIITGDHSYPLGEHGYYHNEVSFYEEFFRTSFLLFWDKKVVPARIKEPCSQMDIAPTILDLLNLPVKQSHFIGKSMLSPLKMDRPIYLIQPYNGRFLSIVKYPYKYIKNMSSGREYVFDLQNDPKEQDDLAKSVSRPILLDFRNHLKTIFLNQKLLDNDALLPK